MRILVDTSVWVDFFNGHPSQQAETLARLIREDADLVTCGLIVSEVLQGLRQAKSLFSIERHFRRMDWLSPKEPNTYLEAADLFRRLRERGITIRSTIDCVIASLAAHHDALILSKDRDLTLIVESKLLVLRAMPIV
ncbi:MAG TPA: PIN domain nuclease [Thermoanaerobaculia bacterium]|jgi:predicted nucleic acid-binding protein|nr:PIN domain nuclease [Thermoanaerobaculia bacterium]